MQELDAHVGQIRAALEKAGILDRTLLLFTSDNGGVVAENERLAAQFQAKQSGHAICGALRGRKHSIFEGGFRVPFIVRWPGRVPAGTESDSVVCLTDVLASCAALLGEMLPAGAGEDSFNALPAWTGAPNAVVRDHVILNSATGVFAIRVGDWKLIVPHDTVAAPKGSKKQPDIENRNQLYNLVTDPAETKNLWAEHQDVVQRLTRLLAQARQADRTRR